MDRNSIKCWFDNGSLQGNTLNILRKSQNQVQWIPSIITALLLLSFCQCRLWSLLFKTSEHKCFKLSHWNWWSWTLSFKESWTLMFITFTETDETKTQQNYSESCVERLTCWDVPCKPSLEYTLEMWLSIIIEKDLLFISVITSSACDHRPQHSGKDRSHFLNLCTKLFIRTS